MEEIYGRKRTLMAVPQKLSYGTTQPHSHYLFVLYVKLCFFECGVSFKKICKSKL